MFLRCSLTRGMAVSIGLLAASACATAGASDPAAAQPTTQPRIGVYESRSVAIAYGRSPAHLAQIKEAMADLRKQMDQAQAAKDTQKIDEIKSRGANMQTIAHMQAFSNAPVDDALAAIQDKLPAIAREAGVSVITAKVDFQDTNVQIVDVTNKIVAEFKPDQRTLEIVAELRKHKPISLVDALSIKD